MSALAGVCSEFPPTSTGSTYSTAQTTSDEDTYPTETSSHGAYPTSTSGGYPTSTECASYPAGSGTSPGGTGYPNGTSGVATTSAAVVVSNAVPVAGGPLAWGASLLSLALSFCVLV